MAWERGVWPDECIVKGARVRAAANHLEVFVLDAAIDPGPELLGK